MVGLLRTKDTTKKKDSQLGILAFEAAKTMSTLISLYKSLSDQLISRLKSDVIRSKGVTFLNSKDEGFLLSLTWMEMLEELDAAAASVARIGKKCSDFRLNRFDVFYRELKLGIADLEKVAYGSRAVEKKVRKMEKLVETTSYLHTALEGLTEMEISERKLKQWKIRMQSTETLQNVDVFYQKLESQRREVRHFREVSLWSKNFDKIVGLMAAIVYVIHTRISQVPGNKKSPIKEKIVPYSGPIMPTTKPTIVRFYSRRMDGEPKSAAAATAAANQVFHAAGPSTVGGSGLALRYANVILLAEEYLDSSAEISHEDRESVYEMLPENLKAMVGAKLRKNMPRASASDASLADGWREAMAEMMAWLVPMARDTVAWQMERNLERMKIDAKPKVAAARLVQTLHFANKEKTEAAITEVLVGLSCIFRFENRQFKS